MSREELVGAYLDGRISRRTLIRRLVGAGVTAGAAISYAQLLKPERASAGLGGSNDQYPLVDLRITSKTLADVRRDRRLVVKVTSSEEVKSLRLRVFLKTPAGGVPIGDKSFTNFLAQAGTRRVWVPIERSALAGRKRARFYVQATGADGEGYDIITSTAKTLR